MKKFSALAMAAALSLVSAAAFAADITVDHPWSRATPAGAQVGAGYVTIKNTGGAPDKLLSVASDVAGKTEIHEMSMDNGVMKMRPVAGVEIPAGKSVELKPGGYHIMFQQLKQPLKVGETIKGSLTFERAGQVPVEFKVEAMGAGSGGGMSGGMSGMKH
ncbi:MAG: copper chaperone PCu(A)C [Hyphomicrobiales bacterium]|nr:copper chaperone PCu(A)C [Hyphomicrobiales bacterium]